MRLRKVLALTAASAMMAAFFIRPAHSFFFGEIKTGLQYVQASEKTSYFLYIPSNFSQDKKWPLVIALAKWGSDTKKFAEDWATEAEKRGYIVLCPNWWKGKDDTPDAGDRWMLKIIKKVRDKYSIDPARVLITGFADGGDYAYYLGLRYPKKFSAAAPIGGVLLPAYDNLIYFQRVKRNPIPFLLVNGKNDVGLQDRQATEADVRKGVEKLRNYQLKVDLKEVEAIGPKYKSDFNAQILNWFESKVRG